MNFKRTYFIAHIIVTFLAFITFLLAVIEVVELEQISNAVLSLLLISFIFVILSIYQYKREEIERSSVFYSIALAAMIIILSVVI